MRRNEADAALRSANPAGPELLARLDLDPVRREHLTGIPHEALERSETSGSVGSVRSGGGGLVGALRVPRLALAAAVSCAAAILIALGFGLGSAGSPAPALGAALERLARFSPHVLLDAPGWRAEAAYRVDGGAGVIRFRPPSGVRLVRMDWRAAPDGAPAASPLANAVFVGTSSVLGSQARLYAREIPDGAKREYVALWEQSGRQIRVRSVATSLDAFEHQLAALRVVDRRAWLAAVERRLERRGEWMGPRVFSCRPLTPGGPTVCS